MQVRLLNKKTEIEEVNKFLPFQVKSADLPGHTFVAIVKDKIVAMAGLRLMEGEVCFIDSMASNSSFEGAVRNEALDNLTKTILDIAKNLGFKKIFATTKENCIVERAERHGFNVSPETILIREI